ncbi:hypothetical protein Lal_00012668, partial [Lupinus albus]
VRFTGFLVEPADTVFITLIKRPTQVGYHLIALDVTTKFCLSFREGELNPMSIPQVVDGIVTR